MGKHILNAGRSGLLPIVIVYLSLQALAACESSATAVSEEALCSGASRPHLVFETEDGVIKPLDQSSLPLITSRPA